MPDSQCRDMSSLSRGLMHDPYPFSSYDAERPRLTMGETGTGSQGTTCCMVATKKNERNC
jgi:hypothetical protein